tara:strand:- start:56926 stop:57393 length:468 start_codon:yes stop_codon:yes gene_type:complete
VKKNSLFLLIFGFSIMILLLACSAESKMLKGEIVQAVVVSAPQGAFNSKEKEGQTIERELPSVLWASFQYDMLNNRYVGGSGGAQREEFCVVSGNGNGLDIGTEVYIVDEARCLWVLHQVDDENSNRYNISITKVRSVETGKEGWTWSKSVKIVD